jgi:hypothetical protein
MDSYKHTQFGKLIVLSLLFPIVVIIGVGATQGWNPILSVTVVIFPFIGALCCCLAVEVDAQAVRCRFGIGLISRTVPLDDIVGATKVRNKWYYGWGIRFVPGGWMFNVSGLDAVELQLKNGRCFRIGTDEPDALATAISHRLTHRGRPLDPGRTSHR